MGNRDYRKEEKKKKKKKDKPVATAGRRESVSDRINEDASEHRAEEE